MAQNAKTSAIPDIFISYAREDLATAEALVAALENQGWSAFIDRQTPIGPRFDRHISEKLRAARCVVVLWTKASIESEWVTEEAADAKKRDVLAPVRLQDVDPPFGFGHRNYADLFGWVDGRPHPGFDQLLARITELAGSPATTPEIPQAYLDWLRRCYAPIGLLGQEQDKSHAFQLDHVYVPALTSPASRGDLDHDRGPAKDDESRLAPVLQRLNDESLIMLAEAGAGKTTFCRWAALRSIAGETLAHPVPAPEAFAEQEPTNLQNRLPLLVPFRELAPDTDWGRGGRTWSRSALEAALAAWVDGAIGDLSGELLTAHLRAGSAFLLLDGIDELPEVASRDVSTVYPRELVLSGLADALPSWLAAGVRVLLTSRPSGMERAGLHRLGLAAAPLEPLPEELQHLFIRRWFHTLCKPDSAPSLIAAIRDRDDLAPLVENPMLLTALCILHDSGGRLPEDRYRLYQRLVDNVLFDRYPGDAKQREPVKARLQTVAFGMHRGDAERPRGAPAAEVSLAEVERLLRRFADLDAAYEPGVVAPAVQCEELLTRSGLLLPRAGDKAVFYHLSFQEFLAAERIAKTTDDGSELERIFRERGLVPEWQSTLLFLFAGQIFNYRRPEWGLELLGRLIGEQDRAAVKANPAPAVLIAKALQLCLAKGYRVPEGLAGRLRSLALDAIEDEIDLAARQTLGLTLGILGDPRIRELRDPGAYIEVPAGRYPFGKEGKTVEIAAPFRIGRYPVTNNQYRAFMEDGGYRERRWWSDDGWAWLQGGGVTEPSYWHARRWNGANQPVVGVSFCEAEACAA